MQALLMDELANDEKLGKNKKKKEAPDRVVVYCAETVHI